MLEKFQQHLSDKFPFLKNKKLLIAISGGIDSVVATHLFHQLHYAISLAHCNFKLRENASDLDEEFVVKLGNDLNISTHTTRFSTEAYSKENKVSTQVAARELRYNWFIKLSKEHSYDYIITAHHADDNLETFLINLSRGTGLDGLTGIPEINGKIARPLLFFPREEIENFATKNNLKWREDSSNKETKYLRNKLRLEIIPKLKEINPNFIKAFQKTSSFLKQSQQLVEDRIQEISPLIIIKEGDLLKINIKKLLTLSEPNTYLYQLLKNYHFTEWNDVYNLLHAQSGKQIVTKSHILLKDRDFLLLLPTEKKYNHLESNYLIDEGVQKITEPIELSFENVLYKSNSDKNIIYLDKKSLHFPLVLRKWTKGDVFFPTGMKGKKKVSKYFKDEKLSVFEKQNIWLLCSNKNEVIWILGKRQDRRFLPTNSTIELLKISK